MVGTSASVAESFQVMAKRVVLESQQAMAAAIKEQRFEDALEHAERVLAVDPANAMGLQFAALLREKVDLDDHEVVAEGEEEGGGDDGDDEEEGDSEEEDSDEEDDSEDEVYDDEGAEQPANGAKEDSDGGDNDDGDDDDDEGEEEEEEEEPPEAIISVPARSLNMTSAQRRQMKEALAKQVYELKIEQDMGDKCSLLGA